MAYFALLYGAAFYGGQWASEKIGKPYSVTLAAMALVLGAACVVYEKKIGFHLGEMTGRKWALTLPALMWPLTDMALVLCGAAQMTVGRQEWAVAVVCGAAEELAFRGWLWEKTRTWTPAGASIVNGLLFGAFHCVNLIGGEPGTVFLQVICASCIGFALCGVTACCGGVMPAMCIHVLINLTGGGMDICPERLETRAALAVLSAGSVLWGICALRRGRPTSSGQ